ncbi:MAG TPA: hypothetical protein VJS12_13125 [Steroidobacteraceae bacterium]|nr:hypothetical protein [Steroidobacteraceae bacterium]
MSTPLLLLRWLARASAYALAAFLVVSGIVDLLGVMPYSDETPAFIHRLLRQLPVLAGAAVLMVPMKQCTRDVPFAVLNVGYIALSLFALANVVTGIARYAAGQLSWQVVPSTLVILVIVAGNAIVFAAMHERLETSTAGR